MVDAASRLEMRSIGKRFGGVQALADVSFDARAGEVHAICGENGAGKSTLMKILSGVINDYEGEIRLNGTPVRFASPRQAEDHGISIIYQELNLVPDLTASANIFLGREKTSLGIFLNDRAMERESAKLFNDLAASFRPDAKVGDLRIGDQQLVEIAKAISLEADIIIMDEPTSALAEREVARLFRVIEQMKSRGVTILYISHKMDEVFKLADRITVLRDGRYVATVDRAKSSPSEIIRMMVGRTLTAVSFRTSNAESAPVLSVNNLSLEHPHRAQVNLLDGVSFDVRPGEIVGVAGLLGAGRTELLESLFGASVRRPSGVMRVGEALGFPRSPAEALQKGVAMVTEDRKQLGLFDQFSVAKNITIGSLKRLSRLGLVGGSVERGVARRSVRDLGVKTASISSPILSLSGGNQQKCIIARALLANPKILLLDEPTRGIDVGAKSEIYQLLGRLSNAGMAILMTSSELPELLAVCDRIMVLCEGRLTAIMPTAEASETKLLEAAMAFSK